MSAEIKKGSKKVLLLFSILVFLLVLGAVIFGVNIKNSPFFSSDKTSGQEKEAEELVERVGKLILLPSGSPTIATVSDRDQLVVGQPFFSNAVNGDKVLIYTSSKKAILYRPSTNMIIEVGPVVEEASFSADLNTTPSPSIESTK